jgi:hypothetical protein
VNRDMQGRSQQCDAATMTWLAGVLVGLLVIVVRVQRAYYVW